MEVVTNNYMPGDPRLVEQLVYELKSQGIFDQFRKECIADVDTKPAYQNLRQRVEGSVTSFLNQQTWRPDMNKNQVREQLRKNIYESGYLDTGVERIVDQVVNPKINSIFLPQVEDVVYRYLGIEKPNRLEVKKELKIDVTDLLPTDLEAISPESDHTKDDSLNFNDSINSESKMEEDESPPFEPIAVQSNNLQHEDNSVDSHLSGFSGLQSHDSNSCTDSKICQMELSNQDSQVSQNSSESRLSIITSEDNTKMEIREDSESKLLKSSDSSSQMEISPLKTQTSSDFNFAEKDDVMKVNEETDSNSDNNVFDEKNLKKQEDEKETDKTNDIKKKQIDEKQTEDRKYNDRKSDEKKYRSSDKYSSKDKKDDKYRKSSSSSKEKEKSNSKYSSSSSSKDKAKTKDKKESRSSSSNNKDKDKSEKDKNEKDKDKIKSDKDKDKNEKEKDRDRKNKDRVEKDKSEKSKSIKEKEKSVKDKDKDKSKSSSSSNGNSSSSKYNTSQEKEKSSTSLKSDSSKRDKEKSRVSSSSSSKDKSKSSSSDSKSKSSSSDKYKKDDKSAHVKHSSSSSSKKDKDKKKISKKDVKDDHYSSKDKKNDRRSTDRDSNDGRSSKQGQMNSFGESNSSQAQKSSQDSSNSNSGSGSGDSGTSDQNEHTIKSPIKVVESNDTKELPISYLDIQKFKYMKPKFASNFEEARKLMKIRKQLAKLERHNQLSLTQIEMPIEVPLVNGINSVKEDSISEGSEDKNVDRINKKDVPQESKTGDVNESEMSPKDKPLLKSRELSKENWEALEARLAQEMSNVNYNSYESPYDDYDCGGYNSILTSPKKPSSNTSEKCVEEENVTKVVDSEFNKAEQEQVKECVESVLSQIDNAIKSENEINDIEEIDQDHLCNFSESAMGIEDHVTAEKINDKNYLVEEERHVPENIEKNKNTNKLIDITKCYVNVTKMVIETEDKVDNVENTHYSDSETMEPCIYLEPLSPRLDKNLQFLYRYIEKLEQDVKHSLKTFQNNFVPLKERYGKRKLVENVDLRNNNKAHYEQTTDLKKRRRSVAQNPNSVISKANKEKLCNSSDISPNDSFSLPLSPAESDKSSEKKEEESPKPKLKRQSVGKSIRNQRYSSEDLYKPRPIFMSSRRNRSAKNLGK